jgi:IS30 family transposase
LEKTLNYDQGKEMAAHKVFASATDMKVYFADPHSPWQRGTNENTNGLLRQYFSKGTALSGYTQVELNAVAERLNDRPRKTLSFATPKEAFSRLLAELNENLEIKPGVAYAT